MANVQSVTLGDNITELTLITDIIHGRAQALKDFLNVIIKNPGTTIGRINTIHYARWVLIDNDTRLLFCSNFDGTLMDYLKDFALQIPQGLDGIWGNCVGYVSSTNFPGFVKWVQQYQVPVACYYAAYPAATVPEVVQALDWKSKTDDYQQKLSQAPKQPEAGIGPQ
jgi:hypothetical protein